MPKAQKLPSGNWRVRVFTHAATDRKKHYKSFTAPTKKEAEFMASGFYINKENTETPTLNMTLQQAFDRYIESVESVLSPSTINQYDQQNRCYLQDIMHLKLSDLNNEILQKAISKEAEHLAPKTVQNISGLLSKVLKTYHKNFRYDVALPQKEKNDNVYIPTEDEIKRLLNYTENRKEKVYVPLLLAACFGLRRSEIVGLKWSNVNFNDHTIKIKQAIVRGRGNGKFEKGPKSFAGYRTLPMPEKLEQALLEAKKHSTSDHVTTMTGDAIYDRFSRCLKELDIPHFRLHDIRHYNASIMLAMNIPNKYAAARMGHATEDMLKKVYQHIMEKKKTETDNQMTEYFDNFFE